MVPVDVDSRRLRYFVAVAEELHFRRAAERLRIAQPALSQQIRGLEATLGVQLFDRTTRVVSLTPAGARFADRVRPVLAELDAAVAEVRRIDQGEEGTIRLGFIGSATFGLMPRAARALRALLPSATVELRGDQLSGPLAEAVRAGEVDLAVLRPCPELAGLEQRRLAVEPIVAALPSEHPLAASAGVALADLAGERFIGYSQRGSTIADAQRAACRAAGFEPDVALEVSETATLVTFVASGLGVSLVPEGVEQVRIPGVVYVPLADPPTIPLLAAWQAGASENLIARTVHIIATLAGQG